MDDGHDEHDEHEDDCGAHTCPNAALKDESWDESLHDLTEKGLELIGDWTSPTGFDRDDFSE